MPENKILFSNNEIYYFDHFINTDSKILVVEYILKKLIENNQDASNLSSVEKLILEYSNFYTFEENIKIKTLLVILLKMYQDAMTQNLMILLNVSWMLLEILNLYLILTEKMLK